MQRAVLLLSHGTFDDLADLPAFVTQIRRGSLPSDELIAELRHRYEAIGGTSPLNAISSAVARKLQARLGVPVVWANRLWTPYVRDVLRELLRAGTKRVAVVPLAQHSAHVYADAARDAGEGMGLDLVCAQNWGRGPKLCEAFAERIVGVFKATREVPPATIVMTAHSLPRAVVAKGDPYEGEVRGAANAIAAIVRRRIGEDVLHVIAFQSQGLGARAPDGKPVEWLGPDVRASIDAVAALGATRVIFAPIGFLADHVEVLYDLDIEARAMAEARRLSYFRAPSLNADDDLVDVLADVARPLLGHE